MSETTDPAIDLETYDPMERSVQQCPFPFYEALRQEAPVYHHPKTGMYFVSRHDTVNTVLRDTETFSSRMANRPTFGSPEVTARIAQINEAGWPRHDTMLTIDPPAHTRYRKLVSQTFSARRIARLEPQVRAITTELIDAFPDHGTVDFHNSFAVALPVKVIHYALNMAPGREPDIKRWSDDSVAAIGAKLTDERRIEAARGVVECQQYWYSEYEQRLAEPRDDILTELSQATFDDPETGPRQLEFAEIYSILSQLMVAGNETTTKLINETIKLLIEQPQWWDRIVEDPSLVPLVVEEGLRVSSPNQGLFRLVTRDTELEGVAIPAGSMVWVMFGSANRDDRLYTDPDVFDPERANLKDHLAFGKGHHFCIGAPLSRLEAKVAFEELTRRLSSVAFAPGNTFEYEPSYILRGLASLDLDITKGRE